jgi:hypothetical protein
MNVANYTSFTPKYSYTNADGTPVEPAGYKRIDDDSGDNSLLFYLGPEGKKFWDKHVDKNLNYFDEKNIHLFGQPYQGIEITKVAVQVKVCAIQPDGSLYNWSGPPSVILPKPIDVPSDDYIIASTRVFSNATTGSIVSPTDSVSRVTPGPGPPITPGPGPRITPGPSPGPGPRIPLTINSKEWNIAVNNLLKDPDVISTRNKYNLDLRTLQPKYDLDINSAFNKYNLELNEFKKREMYLKTQVPPRGAPSNWKWCLYNNLNNSITNSYLRNFINKTGSNDANYVKNYNRFTELHINSMKDIMPKYGLIFDSNSINSYSFLPKYLKLDTTNQSPDIYSIGPNPIPNSICDR